MNTLLLKDNENDINTAGKILADGGLVAIPTETVYGLAANALNPNAVKKIFEAKGRPMDNPLIVHIADFDDIKRYRLVSEIPEDALKLAQKFWSGPLTIIMPKGEAVPDEVSAGLDTVAIRFPSHKTAQSVIKAAGCPLAAPSANISGSPSPTTAQHVMSDLNGRIDAVLDGGECSVGLESTVITLAAEKPRLLRPGGITVEEIESVIGEIDVDDAVLNELEKGVKASSPGMKYKHYSPKARVILVLSDDESYIDFVNSKKADDVAALCYKGSEEKLSVQSFTLGAENDYSEQAHELFKLLREIDKKPEIKTVYARCPKPDGVGMAVYNRLIRAAGFEVINLEEL
ncbi:MAG: threonylcarbamoyl-AMP synthase [Ruminococcus sp.]|nr:threonylcarbamoyl-AMP synthase [Ruminococcus sp.]